MSYEITATSVSSAIGLRLHELFPEIAWYRESLPAQKLEYPHFFVHTLTTDIQPERVNHWMLHYLATVRYRAVDDPSKVVGSLQERLDDMAIKLLSDFDSITWGDYPVRLQDRRVEKVDGVLHFFCDITVMTTKSTADGPRQEQLDTHIASL